MQDLQAHLCNHSTLNRDPEQRIPRKGFRALEGNVFVVFWQGLEKQLWRTYGDFKSIRGFQRNFTDNYF